MKFYRNDPSYDTYNQWKEICPEGSYVTVAPMTLSGLISYDLLQKTNSVVVIASGTPQGTVYVANLRRVDEKDSAIDQTPFIAAFDHIQSAASGGYVQHGNWTGRTEYPGQQFFNTILASGIQVHYPLAGDLPLESGTLDQLHAATDKDAFWNSLNQLDNS